MSRMNKQDLKGFFKNHLIIMRLFILILLIYFPIVKTIELWTTDWKDIKDDFLVLINTFIGNWSNEN